MSAIAAIVLADSVPANHTFNPVNIDQAGIAKWADRSGGIALGFPVVSMLLRNPTKGSRNYKLTAKIVTPVLEVTSPSTSTGIQPAPTKAYDLLCTIDMVLPERSTLLQRSDLVAFLQAFVAKAVFTDAAKNFESVY